MASSTTSSKDQQPNRATWTSQIFSTETTQVLSLLEQLSFCSFQTLGDQQITCKAALSLSQSSNRKLFAALIHVIKQQPLKAAVPGSERLQAGPASCARATGKMCRKNADRKRKCRLLRQFRQHATEPSMLWQSVWYCSRHQPKTAAGPDKPLQHQCCSLLANRNCKCSKVGLDPKPAGAVKLHNKGSSTEHDRA